MSAPTSLDETYTAACARPSDINEHLPKLRELAERCESVTEFGTRWANGSSVAFLAAAPKKLVLWDVDPSAIQNAWTRLWPLRPSGTRFELRVGSTLEVEIEPTDLLFIDTLHTYKQLRAELERHGAKARRYLAFHDTDTFGWRGEDGTEPGLRRAIEEFERTNPQWVRLYESNQNNGLVVLGRRPNVWDTSRVLSQERG